MAEEIRIPKLGMSATEVILSEWMYGDGEAVAKGDIIYMGRAEAELSYDVMDELWVSLDGWAERSDRADVRVGARRRGIIPLQTVWGSTLTLNIALGSEREYERVRMQ